MEAYHPRKHMFNNVLCLEKKQLCQRPTPDGGKKKLSGVLWKGKTRNGQERYIVQSASEWSQTIRNSTYPTFDFNIDEKISDFE